MKQKTRLGIIISGKSELLNNNFKSPPSLCVTDTLGVIGVKWVVVVGNNIGYIQLWPPLDLALVNWAITAE